jgi:hypothetical protein
MITRVDLFEVPTGILVRQYEDGWRTTNTANEAHINYGSTLAEMVAWFEEHGWTVRTWPGGARAFKGSPRPVRDATRAKIEARSHIGTKLQDLNWQFEG